MNSVIYCYGSNARKTAKSQRAAALGILAQAMKSSNSLLDFVRGLHSLGGKLFMHGRNPCIRINHTNHRLSTIGALDQLRAVLRRWDNRYVHFQTSNSNERLFGIRLHWILKSRMTHDPIEQLDALNKFLPSRNQKEINHAISYAWDPEKNQRPEDRLKLVCEMLIKQRRVKPEPVPGNLFYFDPNNPPPWIRAIPKLTAPIPANKT
jgi:hypothetical protein